jgi:hypothetical protein
MKISNYHRYIIGIILGVLFTVPLYSKWSYYNLVLMALLILTIAIDFKYKKF